MSYLEKILAAIIKDAGIEAPQLENRFYGLRRWRADMIWLDQKLIVEIEGGLYVPGGGRHQRMGGIQKDMEKYNTATLLGYKVLRVSKEHIFNGQALRWIKVGLGIESLD